MAADTIIAKRGDVILRLGKEGELTTTALVSSAALSLASPVFEAMFNGCFAEGQALSSESPREVPLPDDELMSMLLICRITHMRTADLPEELTVETFADFASTCDKYQCSEAVEAWSKVWTRELIKVSPGINFDLMVLATYMLDMPLEFYEVTVILARD